MQWIYIKRLRFICQRDVDDGRFNRFMRFVWKKPVFPKEASWIEEKASISRKSNNTIQHSNQWNPVDTLLKFFLDWLYTAT